MLERLLVACGMSMMIGCAAPRSDGPAEESGAQGPSVEETSSSSSGQASEDTGSSQAGSSETGSGGGETSAPDDTGSAPAGCELPVAIDLQGVLPSEALWREADGSVALHGEIADGAAMFSMWLDDGFAPFVDGFVEGAIDLADESVRAGAGMTVSEPLGGDDYRVYLATSGTLFVETFEPPADGSRLAGRMEGVLLRELDVATEMIVEGGCNVSLVDVAFELVLTAAEGGETGTPGG